MEEVFIELGLGSDNESIALEIRGLYAEMLGLLFNLIFSLVHTSLEG